MGRRRIPLGPLLAAAATAVFWALTILAAARWLELRLHPLGITLAGAAIFAFTFLICAALALSRDREEPGTEHGDTRRNPAA